MKHKIVAWLLLALMPTAATIITSPRPLADHIGTGVVVVYLSFVLLSAALIELSMFIDKLIQKKPKDPNRQLYQ